MLVNLKEILAIAEERKCAVGAFNTPNLECLIAVIDAAEKLGTPVIISHAELHENISPLEKIGPVMVQAAEKAGVPVWCAARSRRDLPIISRDHWRSGLPVLCTTAAFFPYEENLMNTKKAVAMARASMPASRRSLERCPPARSLMKPQTKRALMIGSGHGAKY